VVRFRKKLSSTAVLWCWALCLIFLIDAANLLNVATSRNFYQLEEGELLALIDDCQNDDASPIIHFPPEPDTLRAPQTAPSVIYDVDSPLLHHDAEIKDCSFSFFKHSDTRLYLPLIRSEILYLKNCILLI